jgi:hypothetical protein
MSSLPSTNVAPVMQMREGDWRALLSSIRSGNLIPMVGPDLMRVKVGDRLVTYDHLLAEELANQRGISDADLALMGTSLAESTLNDVVSVCIKREGDRSRYELHDDVWQIIENSDIQPPEALIKLAQITDLGVFVTSTADNLFENALRKVGGAVLDTKVYRRIDKEKEDLGKDARVKTGMRHLYYLFGKAEPGTMDFAICDEDVLRFVLKLHDTKYRPKRLFDALRESNLLLLGVNFSDWLARFFLWLAKDRENLNAEAARNLREYVSDQKVGQDTALVLFLQHFSQSTLLLGGQPEDFVNELHRRWLESNTKPGAHAEPAEPKPPSEMPKGAIFLSYSRSDSAAVKTLFRELTSQGISAWYDAALGVGDEFDQKLEYNIENCSFFVPLVSTGSLSREQGYFRKEWKRAVERDEQFYGTAKAGIIPVIVDEDNSIIKQPQAYQGMPRRFREVQMYHCPLGVPTSELIESLRDSSRAAPSMGGQPR